MLLEIARATEVARAASQLAAGLAAPLAGSAGASGAVTAGGVSLPLPANNQQLQASRHARRVYVGGIPAGMNEVREGGPMRSSSRVWGPLTSA
jgi:hypothetical protein